MLRLEKSLLNKKSLILNDIGLAFRKEMKIWESV